MWRGGAIGGWKRNCPTDFSLAKRRRSKLWKSPHVPLAMKVGYDIHAHWRISAIGCWCA
jgi:hypothetical protein